MFSFGLLLKHTKKGYGKNENVTKIQIYYFIMIVYLFLYVLLLSHYLFAILPDENLLEKILCDSSLL